MAFKNNKIAFVFPGQGAQYIGMAQDFVENNPELAEVLNGFDAKYSVQLQEIMFNGPEEQLKETRFTQPAILFHSLCAFKEFQKKFPMEAEFVAGHSLGEFSSLVATGTLSLEDAMYLVHRRGEFMIKANEGQPFAMAAVMGLDSEVVAEICREASKTALVVAANFNTPVQTVISGTAEGVALVSELAKERKAKRVLPLVVGGPFHSPLIAKAGEWLAEEFAKVQFKDAQIPVVANVNAQAVTDAMQIQDNLKQQVTASVLWVDSVRYMMEQGVKVYLEFGPQKVLSGMIKNIDKEAICFNIDKVEDIDKVISELENLA